MRDFRCAIMYYLTVSPISIIFTRCCFTKSNWRKRVWIKLLEKSSNFIFLQKWKKASSRLWKVMRLNVFTSKYHCFLKCEKNKPSFKSLLSEEWIKYLTSFWKKNGANWFLLMSYEIGKKVRYNRLRAKKIFRWTGRACAFVHH